MCYTNLLRTNVRNLSITGGNIYVNSIGHIQTVNIRGTTVVLRVGGALYGGRIYAQNLSIYAFGDIGRAGAPLHVQVPGQLIIVSEYGRIYVVNQLLRLVFLIGIRLTNIDGLEGEGLMLYLIA